MKCFVASISVCVFAATTISSAQSIRPETIKDEPIGWMRVLTFTKPPAPVTVDARQYSSAQMQISELFTTWMQATYVPKGGLGDVVKSVSEKLGLYNQNTAALPQSYGALARIYTDLKYDETKKLVRASNSHIVWSVMANGYYGEAADELSTPERYYFTLPSFALQSFGGEEAEKAVDLSRHPVLGQYPSWYQRNSVNGNRKFVMLSKDNQLPYTSVTRGEYIAAMEAAVGRRYAKEKTKIQADANAKYREVALKDLDTKHAKRLAVLSSHQDKYKGRLAEPAEIYTLQPSSLLENFPDMFEGNGGTSTRLKVYTIDPAVIAAAKTDKPQWIIVSWTVELHDPVMRHLHEAVVNRFNFQYIQDYFFSPEKVKGQAYTPLK